MARTQKKSALGRYLNTEVLSHMGRMRIRPRGRVLGDLAGDHKSSLQGFAVEFAGHREYVPGDDTKHIDWRVYYKANKYFIKQYEAETNLIAHILLDCSESMTYGSGDQQKWEYAATLATTLSYMIISRRDKVSFGLFDDKLISHYPPSQAFNQVHKIDELLTGYEPKQKTDMGRTLMEFAPRLGKRSVVLIISDCFDDLDGLLKGLQRFLYDNHDVVLFHIMHHDELSFPFDGNVHFVGMEEMEELKTDAQQLRQAYQEVVGRYLDNLTRGCERNGVEYVLMDTSVPVQITLAQHLASRH